MQFTLQTSLSRLIEVMRAEISKPIDPMTLLYPKKSRSSINTTTGFP